MASKIFQVCFNTTVHCFFTDVARRFWRCARSRLLMFATTLVWSKMRNTGNYSAKYPTYVCTNLCMNLLKLNHTRAKMAVWTQVLEQKKDGYIGVQI